MANRKLIFCNNWQYTGLIMNNYISPPYCLAEMYDGHAACYPLMSHGEYADVTDRQTDRQTDGLWDAKLLHYTFRYGRSKYKKNCGNW